MKTILLTSGLLMTTLLAGMPANGAEEPARPLQPLEFLVGHCWSGKFADGQSTDTHCFESVYGGHFIRDRHVVRGPKPDYQGESLYWRDGKTQKIQYMYFNSDGGVSNGSMQPQGDRLQFGDEEYTGPDGKVMRFRTIWEKKGENGYVATTEQQKGDQWAVAWRVEFARAAGGLPKT